MAHLVHLCGGEKYGDMEYRILLDPTVAVYPATKRTIEWRQAAGTLDPDFVVAWISVVHGLVEFAVRDLDTVLLMDLLVECADREDKGKDTIPVLDLLTAIGLEEESEYWRGSAGEKFKAIEVWRVDREKKRMMEEGDDEDTGQKGSSEDKYSSLDASREESILFGISVPSSSLLTPDSGLLGIWRRRSPSVAINSASVPAPAPRPSNSAGGTNEDGDDGHESPTPLPRVLGDGGRGH